MRIGFYVAMGALLAAMYLAPTALDGMFLWVVGLAIYGAIAVLSPDDCERK